ncbi:hypothetical protein MNEG_15073, partial [Monoraphidium neglectum]
MEDLALYNNAFTGPLPASWGSFKALRDLRLSNNQLQGSIPPSWGAVPITNLRLYDNPGLVGCLPRGLERFQGAADFCLATGL